MGFVLMMSWSSESYCKYFAIALNSLSQLQAYVGIEGVARILYVHFATSESIRSDNFSRGEGLPLLFA